LKKKPITKKEEQNKKRFRNLMILLAMACFFIITGVAIFTYYDFFITDHYLSFLYNYISEIFVYTGFIFLSIFFLYPIFIITVKNPQKKKKPVVFRFATTGIIILFFTIWFVNFSISEIRKGAIDIKSYSNEEWIVKDLQVTRVYWGSWKNWSPIELITTNDGDLVLYRGNARTGNWYRITYLEETKTVIDIRPISKE
jgi:uncharacterized membrane protein